MTSLALTAKAARFSPVWKKCRNSSGEYPNIDQLSDSDLDQIPAMDQATVFGFACNQTPEMMPLPVVLAHQLARHLDKARQESLPYLNPDGKTQVGVEYKLRHPKRIHSLTLVASQKESAPPFPGSAAAGSARAGGLSGLCRAVSTTR